MLSVKEVSLAQRVFTKETVPVDNIEKILFIGRSNVGKSSFINKLINRRDMARTSSKPGKTISINYYLINQEFYFVDLPGYGFAKISKQESQRVRDLLSYFFEKVQQVKLLILLIDSRRGFMKADADILAKIVEKDFKILTILTKSDKIKKSELANQIRNLQTTFGLKTISFSIKSNCNKEEILKIIKKSLVE